MGPKRVVGRFLNMICKREVRYRLVLAVRLKDLLGPVTREEDDDEEVRYRLSS